MFSNSKHVTRVFTLSHLYETCYLKEKKNTKFLLKDWTHVNKLLVNGLYQNWSSHLGRKPYLVFCSPVANTQCFVPLDEMISFSFAVITGTIKAPFVLDFNLFVHLKRSWAARASTPREVKIGASLIMITLLCPPIGGAKIGASLVQLVSNTVCKLKCWEFKGPILKTCVFLT